MALCAHLHTDRVARPSVVNPSPSAAAPSARASVPPDARRRPPMGSADFKCLEDELNDNVEKDVRYWQQNEAKLRAVRNVSTYQEFR